MSEISAVQAPMACVACGCREFDFMFETPDRLHRLPGRFRLWRCTRCRTVLLLPRPSSTEIEAHYPADGYYSFRSPPLSELLGSPRGPTSSILKGFLGWLTTRGLGYGRTRGANSRTTATARLLERIFGSRATYGFRGIPPMREGGCALDVGAGAGSFLAVLRSLGWKVVGVDTSAAAAEAGRRCYGIEILVGDVAELDLPEEHFDYIRISHTLEHMLDPATALRTIRRSLKSDGSIYIETPNAMAYNAEAMGPRWIAWDPPRHVQIFTPDSLRDMLAASGFSMMRMDTIPHSKVFRFEAAYRREERSDETAGARDHLGLATLLRAASLRWGRLIRRRSHSGDNLAVWARAEQRRGAR